MKTEYRKKAIEIITRSPVRVAFNVPVHNSYSNVYEILILRSNATLIKQLTEAGYSLFVTKKGVRVDKFI